MKSKSLLVTLLLLGLIVILISVDFYFRTLIDGLNNYISPQRLLLVINTAIFIIILIVFILMRRLFLVAKQERVLEIQDIYINQLRELVQVIRAQRHDFINHLQAVYVLLKMNENNKAKVYIEDLYHDIKITSEMLRVNIPELSGMLLVKMGVAAAKGISFTVEVETNLKKLKIKPVDINTIVGNLIDNAFEAVSLLNIKEKEVEFRAFDTPKRWVLQVSTKSNFKNRGFDLVSVKTIVEKYQGEIIINSSEKRGTRFTVLLPKIN